MVRVVPSPIHTCDKLHCAIVYFTNRCPLCAAIRRGFRTEDKYFRCIDDVKELRADNKYLKMYSRRLQKTVDKMIAKGKR